MRRVFGVVAAFSGEAIGTVPLPQAPAQAWLAVFCGLVRGAVLSGAALRNRGRPGITRRRRRSAIYPFSASCPHNHASVPIPKFARVCCTLEANFGIEGH